MTYESESYMGYGGCKGSLRSKNVGQESGLEEMLCSLIVAQRGDLCEIKIVAKRTRTLVLKRPITKVTLSL